VSTQATEGNLSTQVTVRNPYVGKKLQIIGFVLFLVGLFWSCHSAHFQGFLAPPGSFSDSLPLIVMLSGLALWIIGRFTHWYHAE
jgi:hypothetical protein